MPDMVAVPSLLFTKLMPGGRTKPLRLIAMLALVGKPVVVTLNVPLTPWVKVALSALVIAGGWFTVRVKFWVASGATPLLALIVMA